MRHAIIALILLVACGGAWADSEARQGSDWVRITANPCTDAKVLAHIPEAQRADYRAASAQMAGVPYAACWRPNFQTKMVELRYDDGDQGLVPFGDLKPVKEA